MTGCCCPCGWHIGSGHFWALEAARRFKSYVSSLLICSFNGYTHTGFHTCMHRCQLEVCKGKRNHVNSGCWSSSQGLRVCDLRTLVLHGRPDVSDLHKPCPGGLAFGSPAPCVALSAMGWGAELRPFGLRGCQYFIDAFLSSSPGKRRDRRRSWRTWQDRAPGKKGLS